MEKRNNKGKERDATNGSTEEEEEEEDERMRRERLASRCTFAGGDGRSLRTKSSVHARKVCQKGWGLAFVANTTPD